MKLIITIVAGCLLFSICAIAQPHGNGIGFGPNNNPARVTPKPTPPGHHFGWQKGQPASDVAPATFRRLVELEA
jgi:hypothetical protein